MSPKKNVYKLDYSLENRHTSSDSFSSSSSVDSLETAKMKLEVNGNLP